MYEIRDNQVVKVTEGITPVTSVQIQTEIDSIKTVIEDMNKQVELMSIDLDIVLKLESELKQ